jgi:PAS domain S-box-containing protein
MIIQDSLGLEKACESFNPSEAKLRTIIDTIPVIAWCALADGSNEFKNQRWHHYTGMPREAGRGWAWQAAIHPEDLNRLNKKWRADVAAGQAGEIESRLRRSDGEYRWFLCRYEPLRGEAGDVVNWYGINIDIDDLKRAEQKLRESEERLRNENVALREEIESSMFEEIVGSSEPMRQTLRQVAKVAPSDSTVLILGETGTGKELIARALHRRSQRAGKPFVRVNCAAIPQSLIASELFGHEKGAFTGALQRRVGRFESAHGGTLFLDEVGDLPAETQIALLRVLQEREIERIGSNHPISVDVRLIAATNRDLSDAVRWGAFREDLFYRLNVFPITLPPLRDRVADIPLLLEYFVGRFAKKAGKKISHINQRTLTMFKTYDWPGNIRELQNVVERGVILTEGDTFSVDESWFKRRPGESVTGLDGLPALAKREVEMIKTALAECDGRIAGRSGAAAKLKVPRQTLESKIRRFGMDNYLQNIRSAK